MAETQQNRTNTYTYSTMQLRISYGVSDNMVFHVPVGAPDVVKDTLILQLRDSIPFFPGGGGTKRLPEIFGHQLRGPLARNNQGANKFPRPRQDFPWSAQLLKIFHDACVLIVDAESGDEYCVVYAKLQHDEERPLLQEARTTQDVGRRTGRERTSASSSNKRRTNNNKRKRSTSRSRRFSSRRDGGEKKRKEAVPSTSAADRTGAGGQGDGTRNARTAATEVAAVGGGAEQAAHDEVLLLEEALCKKNWMVVIRPFYFREEWVTLPPEFSPPLNVLCTDDKGKVHSLYTRGGEYVFSAAYELERFRKYYHATCLWDYGNKGNTNQKIKQLFETRMNAEDQRNLRKYNDWEKSVSDFEARALGASVNCNFHFCLQAFEESARSVTQFDYEEESICLSKNPWCEFSLLPQLFAIGVFYSTAEERKQVAEKYRSRFGPEQRFVADAKKEINGFVITDAGKQSGRFTKNECDLGAFTEGGALYNRIAATGEDGTGTKLYENAGYIVDKRRKPLHVAFGKLDALIKQIEVADERNKAGM
ncbi:unnamed protein product [Amoebophrya sp. A120]|nr:unnamed protein product [Amoebophrya sp. A120]|eukprot:GSA120T00022476001.1